MEQIRAAMAGTLESSDCMVTIFPLEEERVQYDIQSIVLQQYGSQIRKVAENTVKDMGISGIELKIQDRGALDCVIAARIETAIRRAKGEAA